MRVKDRGTRQAAVAAAQGEGGSDSDTGRRDVSGRAWQAEPEDLMDRREGLEQREESRLTRGF